MEKTITLTPLAEIGKGKARVTDSLVELEINGISGGMKAWLIGGEAVPIGNIVDGKLRKEIDTTGHSGVLITQSGRQMLIGRYAEEKEEVLEKKTDTFQKTPEEEDESLLPESIEGIQWIKKTEGNFSPLCRELRFILSNRNTYENYKKHHCYWIGENESTAALALPVEEDGEDPLGFLGGVATRRNGYCIVCVDKETKRLYIPEKEESFKG